MTGTVVKAALTTTIGTIAGVVAGLLMGHAIDAAQTITTFGVEGFRMAVALAIV